MSKTNQMNQTTYEHVDRLDDVEEDLVLAVLDTLRAPRHCIGNGHRWPRCNVELV